MKFKNKKVKVSLICIIGIIIIGIVWIIGTNHLNSSYDKLKESEKQILDEVDKYCKANSKSQIWKDFDLEKRTIMAIDKSSGKAFLINPKDDVSGVFSKKIDMPTDSVIRVYRVSCFAPQMIQFIFDGNFNTIGKKYKVLGNEIFYTKYLESSSIKQKFTSSHYITFLSHEALHYYMQENWDDGSRFSTDLLSKKDIELIRKEYDVLAKIQEALLSGDFVRDTLMNYTKEYIDVMDQRIEKNKEYLDAELSMETAEGTATYVGIKASQIVGYDYGVMYFDNVKNVLISDVMTKLDEGYIEKSFLADRMPYETGTLLCLLMDAINVEDWQEKLNNQTSDNPVTLYSILKEFSESNS
ncbi:hypothetical protein FDG50_05825 [Clostridium botulinum]|nr:hypothetical protein [Clostridium botulinum]NFG64112.1 hypothetical protein [Clostridium botulinum]NFQ23656.1 hypothetical protein [Clostridium botulinum]